MLVRKAIYEASVRIGIVSVNGEFFRDFSPVFQPMLLESEKSKVRLSHVLLSAYASITIRRDDFPLGKYARKLLSNGIRSIKPYRDARCITFPFYTLSLSLSLFILQEIPSVVLRSSGNLNVRTMHPVALHACTRVRVQISSETGTIMYAAIAEAFKHIPRINKRLKSTFRLQSYIFPRECHLASLSLSLSGMPLGCLAAEISIVRGIEQSQGIISVSVVTCPM